MDSSFDYDDEYFYVLDKLITKYYGNGSPRPASPEMRRLEDMCKRIVTQKRRRRLARGSGLFDFIFGRNDKISDEDMDEFYDIIGKIYMGGESPNTNEMRAINTLIKERRNRRLQDGVEFKKFTNSAFRGKTKSNVNTMRSLYEQSHPEAILKRKQDRKFEKLMKEKAKKRRVQDEIARQRDLAEVLGRPSDEIQRFNEQMQLADAQFIQPQSTYIPPPPPLPLPVYEMQPFNTMEPPPYIPQPSYEEMQPIYDVPDPIYDDPDINNRIKLDDEN